MKFKGAMENEVLLFSSKEEYVEFIRDCAELAHCKSDALYKTHFYCIEEVEGFFGVFFGEGADINGGFPEEINFDIMTVEDKNVWPREFPCLLITACLLGISDGYTKIRCMEFPCFVYKSDFDKKD